MPVVCKTLESDIKNNLILHLSTKFLLLHSQNGFLPNRSTLSVSLFTSLDWLNSYKTQCVFFDLSKAFVSISDRKLLQKLSLNFIHPLCHD